MTERRSSDQVLRELVEGFHEVTDCVQDLADTVRTDADQRRKNRVWMSVLGIMLGLFIALQVITAYEASEAREQLLDCSTPEGDCYESQRERTTRNIQEATCTVARDNRSLIEAALPDEIAPSTIPLPEYCPEVP